MRARIRWLDEPIEVSLPVGFRLRLYAVCVGLVAASVPFLHLYLEVDLTGVELMMHALDISLGTFGVLVAVELATSLWQRSLDWRIATSRKVWVAWVVAAMAAVLLLQTVSHDWLPMTEAIRHKHVDAGYGDMSLRVLPLVGLIGYLVLQGVRGQLLRRELEVLRALNEQLARRAGPAASECENEPAVFRHEGRDVGVDPSAITRLQAEENYCRIHVAESGQPQRELLVRTTLSEAVGKLPGDAFLQVHRSHVVAVEHVCEVVRVGRQLELLVDGGGRVPVSRSRLADVQTRLQALLARQR